MELGTFTYTDGSKYVGNWKNDQMHGQGTLIGFVEKKYIGEWNNDEKHGYGIYTWPDSENYYRLFW